MNIEAILNRWKEILVAAIAVLVLLLQIVNILLTGGGHESIQSVIAKLQAKSDKIGTIVESNEHSIEDLAKEVKALENKH
jgi:uncharacterized protein YpmS